MSLTGSDSASATQSIQLENCSHVQEIFSVKKKTTSNVMEDEFLDSLVLIRKIALVMWLMLHFLHACYFKKRKLTHMKLIFTMFLLPLSHQRKDS